VRHFVRHLQELPGVTENLEVFGRNWLPGKSCGMETVEPGKALALKRLHEDLARLPAWSTGPDLPPEFLGWRARVYQSLRTLFGSSHGYCQRFDLLIFTGPKTIRNVYGHDMTNWDPADQRIFKDNLTLAQGIISEAIEEAELTGGASVPAPGRHGNARFTSPHLPRRR